MIKTVTGAIGVGDLKRTLDLWRGGAERTWCG